MKHCKHCNIDTNSSQRYCPLCFNDLDEIEDSEQTTELYLTRKNKDRTFKTKYFLLRLFAFISISAIVICAFINFMTYDKTGILWSIIVAVSILYVWILISHTILSSRSVFEKIFFQLLGIMAILVSSNLISGGNWLLNYVIPSVAIATAFVLTMITLVSKNRSIYVSTFLVIYILLFILSIVLVYAKFDNFKLLNQINMIYCALAILGSLIFGFKTIKNDITKKFHM